MKLLIAVSIVFVGLFISRPAQATAPYEWAYGTMELSPPLHNIKSRQLADWDYKGGPRLFVTPTTVEILEVPRVSSLYTCKTFERTGEVCYFHGNLQATYSSTPWEFPVYINL